MCRTIVTLLRQHAGDSVRIAHAVKTAYVRQGSRGGILDGSYSLQDVAACLAAVARESVLAENLQMRRAFDQRAAAALAKKQEYPGLWVAQVLKSFADVGHGPTEFLRCRYFERGVEGPWNVCVSSLRSLSQLGAGTKVREALCLRLERDPDLPNKGIAQYVDLLAVLRLAKGGPAAKNFGRVVLSHAIRKAGELAAPQAAVLLRSCAAARRAGDVPPAVQLAPKQVQRVLTAIPATPRPATQHLAEVLWAGAAHQALAPEWVLEELHSNLADVYPNGVGSVLHALALLREAGAVPQETVNRFFGAFHTLLSSDARAGDALGDLDGKGLTTLLWSHATVRSRSKPLLAITEQHLASPAVVMTLAPSMVTNVLWAYAVMGHRPAGVVRMMEASIAATKAIAEVAPRTAAVLAWCLVKLEMQPRFLRLLFAQRDDAFWRACSPGDGAAIIWASLKAKAGVPEGRIADELLRTGQKMLQSPPGDQVTHIPRLLWSYSTLRVPGASHEDLVVKVADAYSAHAVRQGASVEDMAKFARALASLGPFAATHRFFSRAQPQFVHFAASERLAADTCCTLAYAYSQSRLPKGLTHTLCAALAPHLTRHLPQLTPVQTAGLASALVRMRCPHPRGLPEALAAQARAGRLPAGRVQAVYAALAVMAQAAGFVRALRERVGAGHADYAKQLRWVEGRLAAGSKHPPYYLAPQKDAAPRARPGPPSAAQA